MKVAIMQPYFFPYLGYFQLIAAVDVFVIYDDVNYIKGGWINRNKILANGQAQRVTLSLDKSSPNLRIDQIYVADNGEKLLKTILQNYSKAPYFKTVYPMIEEIVTCKERSLGDYLTHLLKLVCAAMGIQTKLVRSSELRKDNSLGGQDKVLAICKELHATHYINSIGGQELYHRAAFLENAIKLSFLQTRSASYCQFGKPFVSGLSIIDLMMFTDLAQRRRLLFEYDLV